MSDSEFESESFSDTPTAQRLEKGLRDTVASIFRTGNTEELTVKRVRLATEQALGLDEGFFKGHSSWRARSDQIIRDEVEAQEQLQQEQEEQPDPSGKRSQETQSKSTKRTSGATSQTSRKKRKKDPTPETDEVSPWLSEEDEEDDIKGSGRRRLTASKSRSIADSEASQVVESDSDVSDAVDEPKTVEKSQAKESANDEDNAGSESEMSVLIDEEPEPKKQRQKPSKSTQGKKQKAPAKKRKEAAPEDPDQAEIKRLQGWLVKCGIRKMWSRELAPYDNAKSKIKHLKQMLKDVGMEGRYSTEKASRIREERELQADLEFVQEGEKKWGKVGSEDEGRPRRRLARGFKSLDFFEDEGEEESD